MSLSLKKHKVKPPRKSLYGDVGNFDTMWDELRDAFREVHRKCASKLSYEQLYRKGYTLVLKKMGQQLYEAMQGFETEWLSTEVMAQIQSVLTSSLLTSLNETGGIGRSENEKRVAGEQVLRTVDSAWSDYQTNMAMIADVLMYLDRVYCKDHRVAPVYSMSMTLFRKIILESQAYHNDDAIVLSHLTKIVLSQIRMERHGDIINHHLIKRCMRMLEGLFVTDQEREEDRLYNISFEHEFLESSRQFYQGEAERMLTESDAGAYCRLTRRRIDEEQDRCRSTLSESTSLKIVKVVEEELIQNRIGDLIASESGVRFMVENDLFEELALIYDLNRRVDPSKTELKKAIQKKIVEAGTELNNAAVAIAQPAGQPGEGSDPNRVSSERSTANATAAALQWVDDVLSLKDKYDLIWARSFDSDQQLQTALTRSFSDFINSVTFPRRSEFISLFIDDNMKKGIKGKTEDEIDQLLDKAITLLRYVQDKDLFERYYKRHLCRRLISNKSISNDVEKQMISRMKIELGNNFTVKLEAMFKDMTISEELTSGYKAHAAALGPASTSVPDLHISVLTSTTWPLETLGINVELDMHPNTRCRVPPIIGQLRAGFEAYYATKHSGRQLTWISGMGTADLRATFPKVPSKDGSSTKERRHELNVSTYAMVVLLLFNDVPADTWFTFEELQAETNIQKHELMRTLQSLAVAPKTRILIKEPMSKDVKTTDRFAFNESFQSKFHKVKVGVVLAGNKVESEKERVETEKKNEESRAFCIEAAVVRIMKQRKELSHQQLVAEVLSQLAAQFKPEVGMIKKRVESLIEREYLERVEDAALAAYRYLA